MYLCIIAYTERAFKSTVASDQKFQWIELRYEVMRKNSHVELKSAFFYNEDGVA